MVLLIHLNIGILKIANPLSLKGWSLKNSCNLYGLGEEIL